ncbi:MAG: PLP-dependent transferase [Verrucomicrobia bacterium]|nr:PLP-dependent transferase [Verrucomicrobiota bacterium]
MSSIFSQCESLPAVDLAQPESKWIHSCGFRGPFGITASVESFDEVLDWQEKRRALVQGYYRLIHPPRMQHFQARLEKKYPGYKAVFLTSAALARKEISDLMKIRGISSEIHSFTGIPEQLSGDFCILDLQDADADVQVGVALCKKLDFAAELHERNRRRGGALSARNVAWILRESDRTGTDPEAEKRAGEILLELEQADYALFYPSGMAAVTSVLEAAIQPGRNRFLVMGNVYRDTHMLLEEMPWAGRDVKADFLDTHDLDALSENIRDKDVAAVFLETITNPLIEVPELPTIIQIAKRAGVPVLVDSTMATPFNCRPLEWGADVVMHSTSKYLSGNNAHGGGVVLTNTKGWAELLKRDQEQIQNRLSPLEFPGLVEGLNTFPERMERFNRNGEALAKMLRQHPAVKKVYFGNGALPVWITGLGSVVSCELKDESQEALSCVFEAPMPGVVKAPSLGSDVTLFCPYVFLTYYDKSPEYLEHCHLPRHLLRFAVGSELDFEPVLRGISKALIQ